MERQDQYDDDEEENGEYDAPNDSDYDPIQPEPHKRNLSQLKSANGKKKRIQNRPKVQSEWGTEEISMLIKAVEERPAMWDKRMAEYKLSKDVAWQEVAETIGNYSSDECKAKWNNLRVTFNTNLTKYRRRTKSSGQDFDEIKPIIWQYFNSMLFLEAAMTNQSTQRESAITERSFLSEQESSADLSPSPPHHITNQRRRRKRPTLSPSLSPSSTISNSNKFKELTSQPLNVMGNQPIKDQYSAFGEFISSELRSMRRHRAAYVKRKLNRAFVDLMDEVALMDEMPPPQQHIHKNKKLIRKLTDQKVSSQSDDRHLATDRTDAESE